MAALAAKGLPIASKNAAVIVALVRASLFLMFVVSPDSTSRLCPNFRTRSVLLKIHYPQ